MRLVEEKSELDERILKLKLYLSKGDNGTQYGMGYFIMDSWTRMDYPAMYGGILILSSFGLVLFLLLDLLSFWLCKWQRD